MIKKIVWLPYDFDTALGINNEGALVFDYDLEDIDHLSGGADVYNGQESVIWKNVRRCFFEELKSMYQTLRSQSTATSGLSYEAVEKMFEDHQSKWPEAIFNEDAWFKYIEPLINPSAGKEPTAAYLSMLQGSKEEQRKWWLYNRFKYIDSKYNAGSALTDYIQVRGYAKSNITITPYATIYPTVKFGSYLVQERGTRGQATTLVCPLDNVNDTEIYIYSASQLASVGDLSGFKVGFADFSMVTKLQNIKLGDSSSSYSNPNLKELYLGNNVLLKTIDVRNCTALGSGDQKSVNISGCSNVEEVYFDNTQVTSVTLPNGGVLRVLHLPDTITNLTIMNQKNITDLQANVANLSTLRIENCPSVDTETMLNTVAAGTRVRLIGFTWEAADATEIEARLDRLDTMRGLDIQGGNLDNAYVEGTIHTGSLTGEQIASYNARYPYLRITADHVTSYLTFKSYDGETTLKTVTCLDGVPQESAPTIPSRPNSSDGHYSYTGLGWNTTYDQQVADPNALVDVIADRTVYPAYEWVVRTYTVTWVNNGATIETDTNVLWGTVPHYDGSTPTKDGQASTGWLPDPTQPITGNTTFTAQYLPVYTVTFKNDTGSTTLDTQRVVQGGTATYGGTTPTSSEDASLAWLGWATSANSHTANAVLTNVQASMTVYAAFESAVEVAEITDSWDQIIANIDNGTYSTRYKIGNYKPLDLGTEGTINMQIVAMDADELSNGTGYAPLSFLGMELLTTTKSLGSNTYTANWNVNTVRTYLNNDILSLLPSKIQARIQTVKKYTKTAASEISSNDKIWIPSLREIAGTHETVGAIYTKIYSDTASRIKTYNDSAVNWWLRSKPVNKDKFFISIDSIGNNVNSSSSNAYHICLGFCLGLEPETIEDSWETILANENPSASYSVGDTKSISINGENHLMQIVGFGVDDKSDGTGKAKISWLMKDLLTTTHRMNATQTNEGGWPATEMRTWLRDTILPTIDTSIRSHIVDVNKTYYDCTDSTTETSSDNIWLASTREIFGDSPYYESSGPDYTTLFTDVESRKKKRSGSAQSLWLRSAHNSQASRFRIADINGYVVSDDANKPYGVCLGFCTK